SRTQEDRPSSSAAALSVELFRAHLGQRVRCGLLRLPLEPDDRQRCVLMVHRTSRPHSGDRFRRMVLSGESSADFETAYEAWRGGPPTIDALLKHWGLVMTR